MDSSSTPQSLIEEFSATIKFASGDFAFRANKISIKESVDSSGDRCWRVQAFHDIFKDFPPKPGLAGIKEVIAIHLYIGEESSGTHRVLVGASRPPEVKKNSGNLFKIVDRKPDKDNVIDTTEIYQGIKGEISYQWDQDRTRIEGIFSLLVLDRDNTDSSTNIQLKGSFNLLNSGEHKI
jgi:hypothetical protein